MCLHGAGGFQNSVVLASSCPSQQLLQTKQNYLVDTYADELVMGSLTITDGPSVFDVVCQLLNQGSASSRASRTEQSMLSQFSTDGPLLNFHHEPT